MSYCGKCNEGWVCEHCGPEQGWPHGDCPGPGMPCACTATMPMTMSSVLTIEAQHGALTVDVPLNLADFARLSGVERDKAIAKYAAEFAMRRIAQCVLRNRRRADIAAEALTHETVEVENE